MRTNAELLDSLKKEEWYSSLSEEGKWVAGLIFKYHQYFSSQDRKYHRRVRIFKITLLTLAMISTVILGLTTVIPLSVQVPLGLFFSASITFVTAISSYFNYEEYWMRNISIHIHLNIIRDNFILDASSGKMNEERIAYYMDKLTAIQEENIRYWEKATRRM